MKIRILLLAVLTGVSVVACGGAGETESSEGTTTTGASEPTVESTTTSTSAAVTTTSTSGAPSGEPLEWSVSAFDGGLMTSVTQVGEGFVGVAHTSLEGEGGPSGGSLYVSPDGFAWTEVEPNPVAEGEMVVWLSGNRWGAVGVAFAGEGLDHVDLLTSTDGAAWTRTDPTAGIDLPTGGTAPAAAEWGPSGVVVVYVTGVESATPAPLVLFSETGGDWVEVDMPEEVAFPRSVLASSAGYVLLEELADPGTTGFDAWFSDDALSWEPTQIDDVIISGSGGSTGWREGFMVIRDVFDPTADTYGPMVWQSTDGRSWSESTVDPFEGLLPSGYEGSLQGSDLGLVMSAVTAHDHESGQVEEDPDEYLLFSPDGEEWTRWNTMETLGGYTWYYAIGRSGIVALVADMETSEIQVTVWVATPSG